MEFKEIESKANKIKSSQGFNILLGIDNNKILVNSIDCEVNIKDINNEDKIAGLKKNEEGQLLYNITNDIYIPFEEKELKEFIRSTEKEIIFKIRYKYHFDKEVSGAAVIFHTKKSYESKKDINS